jgi:hypothetical protein
MGALGADVADQAMLLMFHVFKYVDIVMRDGEARY